MPKLAALAPTRSTYLAPGKYDAIVFCGVSGTLRAYGAQSRRTFGSAFRSTLRTCFQAFT